VFRLLQVNNDRYANKEDFAVVVQPFSLNAKFHYTTKGDKNVTDLSDLAADCLHLSQKGHALGKILMWIYTSTPPYAFKV
jgi:hypothetical protein